MSSTAFVTHFLPKQTFPVFSRTPTCSLRLNSVPTTAYIAYMTHLFVFPPVQSVPFKALTEATNLSLNFVYLIPTFFPHLTAANHPMLEAIFHIVVAWALLLLAFVSDSICDDKQFTIPAEPFLIGTAFLTNILYLPYLALRKTNQPHFPTLKRTPLLSFAESRALPLFSMCFLFVSLVWGVAARPEFGDFSTRFQSFLSVIENDILAYSFVIDVLVFSIFQAWMVPDDAKRRKWADESVRDRVVKLAWIPFLGLATYIFVRAENAQVEWVEDS